MIAVTANREWVAVPPSAPMVMDPIGLAVPEIVARVERVTGRDVRPDHRCTSAHCEHWHWEGWKLTGFASVVEVLPIVSKCPGRGTKEPHMCLEDSFADEGLPSFHTYVDHDGFDGPVLDDEGFEMLLPHAEPGGLALLLEPMGPPCPLCDGKETWTAPSTTGGGNALYRVLFGGSGIGGQMISHVECPICVRHLPVTVANLTGEIGEVKL